MSKKANPETTPVTPTADSAPTADGKPAATDKKQIPEVGGPKGLEPTRYGDWERKGRCIDF
jgi:hypothetical protein